MIGETPVISPQTIDYWQQTLEHEPPQTVLQVAVKHFGEGLAVVTSFQVTGIVTLHMLQAIAPKTPVLTLDTGVLFPETYTLMDTLEEQLNLNLKRVRPQQTIEEQAQQHGDNLWERDPNLCCHLRKVVPLANALNGYDAWVTGVRRDQSPTRAQTPVVAWDERNQMVKFAPFATWTEDMIWTYIYINDLPYNELHDHGYPSIGCLHCTNQATKDDPRAGRWRHHSKTECGIHTPSTC